MLTLPSLLCATAQFHGQRIAIRQDDSNWTWSEYIASVARTAGALRALGLAAGSRFGILGRNCVTQAQLLLAGYWAGVVPVPLNFRLAPMEIRQMLEDAHCEVVFVDNAFAHLLDDAQLAPWKASAVGMPIDGDVPLLSIDALIDAASSIPVYDVREDDEALVLYTGGTTGQSKGVSLSHRNIVLNAMQVARPMNVDENDVYLHVSPMFHSTDLKATVVSLFGGGHAYLHQFSVDGVLAAVERHRVTILSLVPTMIARMLREGRFDAYDLRSLRLVSYGTSPMDEGVLREAMRVFRGVGFHQAYGLTETSPLLAILDEASHRRGLDERPDLLRAAGRPLPGVDMRFLGDDGAEVAHGEPGEIVVRGPQVSCGYINSVAATRDAFRQGWFHTGDIGRVDEEGYLHVLGRKKELVITGGENVYTREVERVLEQHAQVAEAAVVGVPDAQYGEALLAAIVPNGMPPQPDELIGFCRGQLGGYKIPRRYVFLDRLPRTAVGKVRKHDIVVRYLEQQQQQEEASS